MHTRYVDDGRNDPVSRLSDKSIGVTEGCEHQLDEVRGQMWLKGNATVLYDMLQCPACDRESDGDTYKCR